MAVSLILLEIAGVEGESTIAHFENQIVVDSFSWDVDAKLTREAVTTNMTAQLDAKAVSIKKRFDSASTTLRQMMTSDDPFTATLRVLDPASRGAPDADGMAKIDAMLEIKLEGCHIDKIDLSASDSGKTIALSEDVTISFTKQAGLTYRSYPKASKSRTSAAPAVIPANKGSEKK
ncbi:type VI secretion system tube protein Hcp [Paucibacter sp. R3-3]|uniref:Type VI secretion system tube protein Hcp n=1 Tax=Roseateles agri TaxID=3098619 RepID=A0ABU5DJJ9_9BURK|nr:type VI secretion system tube protein Hcp [Paucibacter sp. R3-3]MDY0745966.1 type VI secretion system tube protein Hcp [Paucibacter sp. R3-3]